MISPHFLPEDIIVTYCALQVADWAAWWGKSSEKPWQKKVWWGKSSEKPWQKKVWWGKSSVIGNLQSFFIPSLGGFARRACATNSSPGVEEFSPANLAISAWSGETEMPGGNVG